MKRLKSWENESGGSLKSTVGWLKMGANIPLTMIAVGTCLMALFPGRVLAVSIPVHTATIVLAAIAAVYITVTALLATAVCCLLCAKNNKKYKPSSRTTARSDQESIELQLAPPQPSSKFKGETSKPPQPSKQQPFPSQDVVITRYSSIKVNDPHFVAKLPAQPAPDTAADTVPMQPPSQPQDQLKGATTVESPPPGSYLGLDMALQSSSGCSLPSTGTSTSDDTVFDEQRPEAEAESSFEERKIQARHKRKVGRTESTKPLMEGSVYSLSSETGPDTPAGDSPDITPFVNWSSKSQLPPTGGTVSTAIKERPSGPLSAITEGRRLLGSRTPPQSRVTQLQRKPSITLL